MNKSISSRCFPMLQSNLFLPFRATSLTTYPLAMNGMLHCNLVCNFYISMIFPFSYLLWWRICLNHLSIFYLAVHFLIKFWELLMYSKSSIRCTIFKYFLLLCVLPFYLFNSVFWRTEFYISMRTNFLFLFFKGLSLNKFWCSVKEEYLRWYKMTVKILQIRISSYIPNNMLNAKADIRIQLSSAKLDIKETCKNVIQC